MGMSKGIDQMAKGPLRQFRCNNEKCWLKVGVTTLTLMSSLTLSMMVANAQTATANVAQTTQTSGKDTPGTVTAQIQSSKSVASASVPTMNATSKNSADSSYSDVSDPNKRASSTTENTAEDNGGAVSRNAVTTDSGNVSSDSKTTQSTQTDTTNKIKDDAYLKSLGIDADHLNSTNVLKIASLFHIFAKQASLNADTNGNLAVGTLKNSNDFGTRGTSDNLTTGDVYYIQNLGSNVISNAFRNTTANHVVLGKGIQVGTQNNKVTINGVQITNLKPGDVSQDINGETYINFDQVFAALLKESTDFSNQVDSDGVKKDFSDQNQRYVDVTNAKSSDGIVYVNVPISNLSAPQAFTIKGLNTKSPTIVINVTDIPAEGVQNISTQVQLVYSSDDNKQETLSNGESHNEPNHVLWNLGTGNQTFNFNSGRFMGSILAPNATINAGVNIDGNIVASTANITGGESHRWDIQSQVPPTDNTHVEYGLPDGIQVKTQVPTTNVPHIEYGLPDGIQVKTQVPTTNVPHIEYGLPDGIQVKTQVPTTNVPHIEYGLPDGIQVKTQVPTTNVPHIEYGLPDGIQVKTQVPTTNVPHIEYGLPDGIQVKTQVPTTNVPYIEYGLPDGIQVKTQVPTTNVPHIEYGLPDGIQVKTQVPTTNVPHIEYGLPDGIQVKTQVPTTNVPHIEYGLPDGIQVKTQVPTTNVPHIEYGLPDGIQVKTQVPTTNVPHVEYGLPNGIQAYFKGGMPNESAPHTYVQGAVPDGVSAYFKAEVPTNDVPHTTIPNVPTQPTTPSAPQPAQPVQPTTPAQPEPNQTVTTGVDGDHAPVMIKAHEQPQTESLIAEDSDAEPQATTGLGRKASVDGQFVSGHTGISQSKPSEIQSAMPQLNEGSEKPVSILGYALLAIGGLTRWLTFKGKRQN